MSLIPKAALESHVRHLHERFDGVSRIMIDGRFSTEPSIIDRIFSRAVISDRGCWLWPGTLRNGSHGSIQVHDEPIYIHRISFALDNGPIPDGLQVLHECDVPNCFYPRHLFLGTQADNIADMWAKGRAVKPPVHRGMANSKATLSDDQISDIRARWAANPHDQRGLAAEYGVSQSSIWRFVHKQTRNA